MNDQDLQKIIDASNASLANPGQNAQPLPKQQSLTNPLLIVFRHGESEDNVAKIFSGWRDAKLTQRGKDQAKELAEKLKNIKIDLCIMSPLVRTQDTARIALQYHPNIKYEVDQRITERNYGVLQGTSKERLQNSDPELAAKYRRAYDFPPPEGESLKMVEERVLPFLEELKKRMLNEHMNVALSCHGNSMRVIRRYFENMELMDMLVVENPLASDYAQYVIE